MQAAHSIQVGQATQTKVVRVSGKGTHKESLSFHAFVDRTLQSTADNVVVDLAACTYLDSTFLGSLVRLCKCHNAEHRRFLIAASAVKQRELFASSQLHKFLAFRDAPPAVSGDWLDVDTKTTNKHTAGRHVMECHRSIGDLDVPDADKFSDIADRLEDELGETQ